MDTPLKSAEDRAKIMEQITGVDFTFIIDSLEEQKIRDKALTAFEEYQERKKEENEKEKIEEKKYETVYVPGTYDLFHAGHLENLMEAQKLGNKIVAGVKSDELVKKQKGDFPKINAEERMEILRHFKFIDGVYEFYTRDLHVASDWVKARYGTVPTIVCGSDLEKDYKNIDDLTIVYTDRDAKKMQERSTTAYKKKLKLRQVTIEDKEKHYPGNIDIKSKQQNKENKDDGEER